jgi:hypothetical protein
MSRFTGSPQTAIEYNSTIIGALELSSKKWVLAVQLPAFGECPGRLRRRIGFFCRASEGQVRSGRSGDHPVILTHEAGRRILAGAFPCAMQRRGSRHANRGGLMIPPAPDLAASGLARGSGFPSAGASVEYFGP